MAYPFAGFGSFLFQRSEWPLPNTDQGWSRDHPNFDQSQPLGSSRDSIVTLAIGSATRSFDCLLTPARLVALEALLNTTAILVDWERPTPVSRSAFLKTVVPTGFAAVQCPDGTNRTQKRIQTRVELVSQA